MRTLHRLYRKLGIKKTKHSLDKFLLPASIAFSALLIIGSFSFFYTSSSNNNNYDGPSIAWTETVGKGISAPACGSSGVSAPTCVGVNPRVTFNWSLRQSTQAGMNNYKVILQIRNDAGTIIDQRYICGSDVSLCFNFNGSYNYNFPASNTTYHWTVLSEHIGSNADDPVHPMSPVGSGVINTPSCGGGGGEQPGTPNNSTCVSHTIPSTMTAGQTIPVQVTFRNTGTNTWTQSSPLNYDFTLYPYPPLSPSFSPAGGEISGTVPTNSNMTLSFNLTAPSTPGTYGANYRLLQQGVEWFGATCGMSSVTVTPAPVQPTGTLHANALLNGNPWPSGGTGSINVSFGSPSGVTNGPMPVPISLPGQTPGNYAVGYISGGPTNATFTGLTISGPSCGANCGVLQQNGSLVFTFNFTGAQNQTLTISKPGTGTGSVVSNLGDINCGGTCSASYANGTNVVLGANVDPGSVFAGWSGSCASAGTNQYCTVVMTQARNAIATFNSTGRLLTVTKAGTGTGTVTSNPSGINCGSTCSASYANGTSVTLTAAPASGSVFAGWSGSCSGTGTCNVVMSQARNVTATFNTGVSPNNSVCFAHTIPASMTAGQTVSVSVTFLNAGTRTWTPLTPNNYDLTLWPYPPSSPSFNPTGLDVTGTTPPGSFMLSTFNLTAPSAPGTYSVNYRLIQQGVEWFGATCGRSVTVIAATTHTLSVTKAGTGTGTVTSNQPGINCGSSCSANFPNGTGVVLNATPSSGSTFAGWSGSCSGTGTCIVQMTQARSVTATFNGPSNTLTTSINSGVGTITGFGINCPGDCTQSYPTGTWVTLIATPATGYVFSSWASGIGTVCTGQSSTCSVQMNSSSNARANFTLITVPSFNYSLSNSGASSVTKTSGNAFTQNTITKTLTGGTTQSVTLTLSGAPAGTSYSIANGSCSPSCSSVITFTVSPSTVAGTYPITVTGSPLNRQTTFNLIVSGGAMSVTCSAVPSSAGLGVNITWTATVTGGTPPYIYSWSGTNIPTSPAPNSNPFNISYSTVGVKTATVRVTGADMVQANCPASTARINFDPSIEEF